ncbi:MAG: substrate-binding domain-containing protein [Pseudobutyrivibrio sp.]|nr:substrate-binding domain-containing protein [Pseudobutyrivibrio sp.]
MKNKKLLIGFFFALLGLILVEYYIYINYSRLTRETTEISFVASGDNLDQWDNMISGSEAAASDIDCIINYVNSPIDAGAEGEIDMINRQISEGADYVIVNSGFYEQVYDYVRANHMLSTVSFVKNGNSKNESYNIQADEFKLGQDFAQYILEENESHSLLFLASEDSVNTNDAIEGLKDGFKDSELEYDVQICSNSSELLKNIYNLKYSSKHDGVVALDSETIDLLVSKKNYISEDIAIYAIDNRQESVYYLDSSALRALAYEDDYALGYITVKHFLEGKSLTRIARGVPLYYIVDRKTMYSEQLEKVLFPFVK